MAFDSLELDSGNDILGNDCDFLINAEISFVILKASSMLIYPKPIILIDKLSALPAQQAASSCSPISVPQV